MGMSALVGIDSVRSAVVHGQYGASRQACYAVGRLVEQAWVGSPNSLTNTTMACTGIWLSIFTGLQHIWPAASWWFDFPVESFPATVAYKAPMKSFVNSRCAQNTDGCNIYARLITQVAARLKPVTSQGSQPVIALRLCCQGECFGWFPRNTFLSSRLGS